MIVPVWPVNNVSSYVYVPVVRKIVFTLFMLAPVPNVELFGSLPFGTVPVNLITCGPSVECQIIFVLLTTDEVGGVKAAFDTSIVWVSTGGGGPVLLPPQAASATATNGNIRRTRMMMSSERVRAAT